MSEAITIPIAVFDNDKTTLDKILDAIKEITGRNAFGTTKYEEFKDYVLRNRVALIACDYTLSPQYKALEGTEVIRGIRFRKMWLNIWNIIKLKWKRNIETQYMLYSSSTVPSDVSVACQSKNIIVNTSYSNTMVLAEDLVHKYDESMLAERSSDNEVELNEALKYRISLKMIETTKLKLLSSLDKIENKQSRIHLGRGRSSTLEEVIKSIEAEDKDGLKLIENFFRSEVLMKEVNEEL